MAGPKTARGFGVAIHAGQKTWERTYGSQRDLLETVRAQLQMAVAVLV